MLKIAIADDHNLFRETLIFLINHMESIEVVVEASNGIELLEKLKNVSVDLLLLDIRMPEMDGFETVQKVKGQYPDLKILILTMMNDRKTITKILEMDIHGLVTKAALSKELEEAIRNVQENGFYFEQSLYPLISEIIKKPKFVLTKVVEKPDFTEMELRIIKYTAKGLKAKEIAIKLNMSIRTVEKHKENILNKSGLNSMIIVLAYCYHHKIIKTEEILSKIRKNTY